MQEALFANLMQKDTVSTGIECRAIGAGPAGAAVAGPILKIAPGVTHGKRASRKPCNILLGYNYKKAADCRIHATSLQECTRNDLRRSKHSKIILVEHALRRGYTNYSLIKV